MSLTHLSAGAFAAGLLALAAALFLLQRLRVRHREVPVVTTLFWREAVEEARARVLVRRFRHPWAYVLAVLLAALLWTAVAGPRLDDRGGRRQVLLLDGSAEMARGDRFARAAAALIEARAARPDATTTVLFCGARERTLLSEGESVALLERRLAGLAPEDAPPTVERTVRALAKEDGAADTSIVVFGVAPVRARTVALAPSGMEIARAQDPLGSASPFEPRVVALGASEAASGDWTAVDLLVAVDGDPAAAEALALDGASLDGAERGDAADGSARFVVRDVPARGQVVTASIGGAAEGARPVALPDRSPVRVALDPALEAPVGPLLDVDPAVERVGLDAAADADVVIARADAAPGSDVAGPARLTFVPDGAAADAFVVQDPAAAVRTPADRDRRALVDALGLAELDAAALATRAGRTIGLSVEPAGARGLVALESLLRPDGELRSSRSLAAFVAHAVRWLADRAPLRPEVLAGEPLADVERLVAASGRRVDAAGLDVVPLRAGRYEGPRGAVAAAFPSPTAAGGADVPDPLEAPADAPDARGGFDPSTWVLLAALLGLAVEWWLHRTGRMP